MTTLRIAIADDEEDIRQYFRRLLPRLGHKVVGEAKTGNELVEICCTEHPDLVITDIMMPEMDGLEAVAEISRQQAIPFIVVSSHDAPTDRAHAHIVEYLVKPITIDVLRTAIEKACPGSTEAPGLP